MSHPSHRARPGRVTTKSSRHDLARRARCLLAAVFLGASGLAACGDDDTEANAAGIEVIAADYRFDDLPSEVDAGTSLTLRNASTAEVHELVAIRIPDDESRPVEELVALPMTELEGLLAGLPALVVIAPPGEDGFTAVGDGHLTEPGRYAVLCFIPIGAEPKAFLDALAANPGEPPQVEGGPPHFTGGMFAELVVT